MNEEIEYAEMLEIPVSTVNVIRKGKPRAKAQENELKEQTITRVNERFSTPSAVYSSNLYEGEESSETEENDEGRYEDNENAPLETYQSFGKKEILKGISKNDKNRTSCKKLRIKLCA